MNSIRVAACCGLRSKYFMDIPRNSIEAMRQDGPIVSIRYPRRN
jgi:hypothetical protein